MGMDWKYLLSLSAEELNEEEKDELYNLVTWYDSAQEKPNLEQSWALLKISQEVLKYKGEQVETLLHELDEVAIRQGEEAALGKIESDKEVLSSARSRKSSAIEIENLEHQYNELKTKYKKQQRINERNLQEIDSLKKKVKSLELEKNQLENDLTAKNDRSDSSDVSETVKDQHRELVESVHSKNKQLSDLLHDIEDVENENILLREKLSKVRDELSSATSEIQNLVDNNSALELQLKESQETIKKITLDNELLQEETQELFTEKTKIEDHLMEFTQEINKRIEDWQKVLEQKDSEIKNLRSRTSETSGVSSSSSQSDYGEAFHHASALQKLLAERDVQLMEVQSKLAEAVKEMDQTTQLMEQLKKEKSEDTAKIFELNNVRKELKKQLKLSHERGQKLQEEVQQVQQFAEGKNQELAHLIEQIRENGNVDEAKILEELQEVKSLNRMNEKQVVNLVKNINKLQDNCDQMAKENSYLREKLGIPEEESLTLPNYQNKQKQYKKEVLRLKKKILEVEEENINLRTEVKNLNRVRGILQEEIAEIKFKNEGKSTVILEVQKKTPEEETIEELDRVIDAELSLSIGEVAPIETDLKEKRMFEEEIKNLCEENEALRKGMHEILNSLNTKKETSLREIKSETFEKLLRALDVKHISGWYHPAMRLQAEVHNMEGINKELREQLRMCRNEIEELKNERQENIILSKRSSISSPRHLAQSGVIKDIRTLDSLNENVEQLLERSTMDAQTCQEIAVKMDHFNRDFFALEKQLENLYAHSMAEKLSCDQKMAEISSKNSQLQSELDALECEVKIYRQDVSISDTVKKMADMAAENVRANLKRGYLEVECQKLRGRIEELNGELVKLVEERSKEVFAWSRSDKYLRGKVKVLEVELEGVVSREEHLKTRKELDETTVKFRQLMEDYKKLGCNNQNEIELMKRSKEMTEHEKTELKNKLNEALAKLNSLETTTTANEKVLDLSKKLSDTEVTLGGERQRANHVNSLYELVKEQLNKSEERFREYEGYAKDLVHKNLVLQGQLKEAEDALRGCVAEELHRVVLEENRKMTEKMEHAIEQIKKLQEDKMVSEISGRSSNVWTSSKEEELLALKHQIVDLLAVSDDKAVIARISSDLLLSRTKENELKSKYQTLTSQLEECHEEWLDTLRILDEEKEKFGVRERHLEKKNRILQDLLENQKIQYYGCVPLLSEQKFVERLKLTLENNHASFMSLHRAQTLENESIILKEQVDIECKHNIDIRKIGENGEEEVQKVYSWLQEKKHVELELIRFRRQAEFKELQLQQCHQRIGIQDEQIAKLEEDLFLSYKGLDPKNLIENLVPSKIYEHKPEPSDVIDKPSSTIKFTRSLDVQTEEVTIVSEENQDEQIERKKCENLRSELLTTKDELVTKEEAIQQLKSSLSEAEMNVSLFRKQIGDKQAQICFYEKHIVDLQQQQRKDESVSQKSPVDNGMSAESLEEAVGLKATIKALQEAIVLKEESILSLQSLLKEDRDNHSLAAARMQEELKMLKNSLAEEKQKRLEYEDPTSESHRSKAAIEQYVKQVHVLEQHADELHTQVTTLESQLQSSRQEAVRWRSLANDRLASIDELRRSLEEQHKDELNVYKRDSEKWREEVLSLKELINKHKDGIMKVQPDLESLLKAKDDKISELGVMVQQLKEELQIETENEAYSRLSEFEKIKEQLVKENETLRNRFETLLNRERDARGEIRDLKAQLAKAKRPATSARSDKGEKTMKEHLQKKVASLEDEVVRLKDELAAQVTINESHRVKIAEDFDRWKRQKQSQQTIEKLKSRLKDKEGESEKLQHTCNGYRSLIDRLEREKHSLENRIKALKVNANIYGLSSSHHTEALAVENAKLTAEIEELKAKLEMQQRHSGGLGAALLQEKLEAQERKLAVLELSGKGTSEIRTELERLQSTICSLQKSNLYLEAKNIELKMDLEKAQKDFPRFREQVQHLESYIEVLKKEMENPPSTSTGLVQRPSPRPLHEGRVVELERTVLILKRVVEKLQVENKRLLAGKRSVLDRPGSVEKLRRDYNRLKEQYGESLEKIAELQSAVNMANLELRTHEGRRANAEELLAVSGELGEVKRELDQKNHLLDKVKVLLQRAAVKEKALLKEVADLKVQLNAGAQAVTFHTSINQV